MIYLDSCAVVKTLRAEPESAALIAHLRASTAPMLTSELTRVEVQRALAREDESVELREYAARWLGPIARLPLASVIDIAAVLPGPMLRSLDALHLATAAQLGQALTEFITYDKRLAAAAKDAGLPVISPK